MSRTVTWRYLTAEQVHRCLAAGDGTSLADALREADSQLHGALLAVSVNANEKEQRLALVDLFVHLIRFAQDMGFSPEKTSTLVGMVREVHTESMKKRLSPMESYKFFDSLMTMHSVHRPPFSGQVFSLDDARHIADYLLHTYYRHYKLYLYAFSAREVANVKTVQLATQHAVPPPTFPSLMRAVPLAQWEAAQEEQRKAEEEAAAKIAEERAAALAEEQRLAQLAGNPTMSQGLRQQLDVIRTTVAKSSKDKLDDLEAKLTALEARMADSNKPLSAGAKGPVKPGKK